MNLTRSYPPQRNACGRAGNSGRAIHLLTYSPRARADAPAGKSSKPPVAAPDKLAVGLGEAAALLSASDDHFREHIKPELRIVRRGKRQFVAIRELERWLSESSAPT